MASKRDDCIKKIADLGGISEAASAKILDDVDGLAQAKRMAGEADPTLSAAYELAGKFKQAAKDARLDAVRNAAARGKMMDRVRENGGIKTAAKTIQSRLYWTPASKNLDSIESRWKGLARQWLAVTGNKLRQEGLWDMAVSGHLDREIDREIWKINETGNLPKGDRPEEKIAAAFWPALEVARNRLNAAGAHIGKALDYVMHTNWDPRQLRLSAGKGATPDEAFAAWWAKDGPRMSEKTFEHLTPKNGETMEEAKLRFARSVFDASITGIHLERPGVGGFEDDGAGYIPSAYEGTGNIAKGVSQQRVIFWKDADSWHDHMTEFGGGRSRAQQFSNTLNQAARNVALMTELGTNSAGNFNIVIRRIEEEYRSKDPDGVKKFQDSVSGDRTNPKFLDNVLARLDGSATRPANAKAAQLFEYAAHLESMSHLGGVGITHAVAAPGTLSSELKMHGVSRASSLGKTLTVLFEGRGSAERQAMLAEGGAYATGYMLDMHTTWQQGGGVPGAAAYLTSHFLKMTGIDYALNQFQGKAVGNMIMQSLGSQAGGEFEKVHPYQKAILQRYGIGPKEWDALRGADPLHVDGDRYLTPKAAEQASEASIKEILREKGIWSGQENLPEMEEASLQRAIAKERWELGDKLLMYINDAAEHSTITPGVRERAMAFGNLKPGSLPWMLQRSFMQFKMWPFAQLHQNIMREVGYTLAREGSSPGPYAKIASGIGLTFALMTGGGYARMAINDFMSGKPQRNPLDPRTILAAFAQGGGAGILGDFLFGETNRMGAGWVTTAMGPIASDIERFTGIMNRFRDDITKHTGKAFQHLWGDLAHFTAGHIPFSNLIYLKAAVEYLVYFHAYEAVSPGWWDRTNRRLLKDTGRAMVGYVPGQGVPWGVPGLYLKGQGQATGILAGKP